MKAEELTSEDIELIADLIDAGLNSHTRDELIILGRYGFYTEVLLNFRDIKKKQQTQ